MTLHINYNQLNFTDAHATKAIEEGGGKNLDAFFADMYDMKKYLPTNSILLSPKTEPTPEKRRAALEALCKEEQTYLPKLVRAVVLPDKTTGHPGDFGACVDFLPSKFVSPDGSTGVQDFMSKIDEIIGLATTEERKKHYEWEGGAPDSLLDHIGLIIQDYHRPDSKGSMIAHPANSNVFIIENEVKGNLKQVININGRNVHGQLISDNSDLESRLIAIYKKIDRSGKIPEGYTFQLEYGVNGDDIKIYQVRLFRKKEEKADFEIVKANFDLVTPFPYTVYGKTDEKGIEISIANLTQWASAQDEDPMGYCFTDDVSGPRESPSLNITPENMTLFWFFAGGSNFDTGKSYDNNHLGHGAFRNLMKAHIAIACRDSRLDGPLMAFSPLGDFRQTILYVSNGVEAGIKILNE